ncbi:MAG: LacI family DNA-binding transcriptional regulator [Anaerolineae bacterium]|nr:LacI family DNA-binding transcriptional regulator [Anaerolineae bacterium]
MPTRKVTIRDVAAEASVSIATVSNFLNDKPGLADATRDRIASAIANLGYLPRRGSATTDPRFVGLLIEKLPLSPFSDMFYGEVIQGIDAYARQLDYHIALIVVEDDRAVPRLLEEHNGALAGVIMLGGGDLNGDIVAAAMNEKLPAVLVDNYLLEPPIDAVLPDYTSGAAQATQYLLQQNYRRIAFLRGSNRYRSLIERYRGYCIAMHEAGIGIDPALIQPYLSESYPTVGYLEMKALLQSGTKFDAVFCVSDQTAFGALQALQEAGVRVPDDVAVLGFDNVAQSSYTTPPLTTVNVPKRTMGEIAVHRLFEKIDGQVFDIPVKLTLPTSLVIRASA